MITGNLNRLAQCLMNSFIQRTDLYAKQVKNGSYVCIQKPLNKRHVVVHLQDKMTLGTYLLDKASQARFLAFDADDDDQFKQLRDSSMSLSTHGVPSYLESSRRGGHMWLFFDKVVSGQDARLFGYGISTTYDLENIEMFPKQDQLQGGPGSLIRLPFGIHRKSGKRYGFIHPNGDDLARTIEDQISLLGQPRTVIEAAFDEFWRIGKRFNKHPDKNSEQGSERKSEMGLSDKIKARISVIDFISQYVELSPTGRGLCPFHDDQNASFSVNIEKNYWKCFAGCGGGSIIDFWMMSKNCDFKKAIRELEDILF